MQVIRLKTRSYDINAMGVSSTVGPDGLGRRLRPAGRSPLCEHVRSGRIDAPKICALNFECYHCGFDQTLDDMDIGG